MKKLIAALSAAVLTAAGLLTFPACSEPQAVYTVGDDGQYYILTEVSGYNSYDIPPVYDDGEHGELPVTTIGERAFMNDGINRVTIPDSITRIENYAFAYSKLISIEIPQSVTYIGYAAFAYCSAIESVTIPSSVTALGPYAFAYCSSLEEVNVEAQIDTLYIGTFKGIVANDFSGIYTNTSLTKISLPSTLKYLHRDAISDNFLTDIYFGGTAEEWQAVEVFYAEEQEVEDDEDSEDGETEIVVVYLTESEKIEYFSSDNLTIHCLDADITYSGGAIHIVERADG